MATSINIDIVITLKNPFNYKEYKSWVIKPINKGSYAQKVGMLMAGMIEFPEDTPEEAYLKFTDNMNKEYSSKAPKQSREDCGSCNDKKRRIR